MIATYLCGGINGLSDTDCRDWREVAKSLLHTETLDPMRRDYRGREDESVEEIVENDLIDIQESTFVLVNATRPSWGTAMEIVYASKAGLGIVAFVGDSKVSPWLRFHCTIHKDIETAVDTINGWALDAGTQYTGKVSDHARFGCYFPR
jgi:hypothetical protein